MAGEYAAFFFAVDFAAAGLAVLVDLFAAARTGVFFEVEAAAVCAANVVCAELNVAATSARDTASFLKQFGFAIES